MARWDPGTEDRLRRAAVELFAEHGYDNVTITQIAERAGITRRSYFRYFPDKREVLFGGSEQLPDFLAEAVRTSSEASGPAIALDAVRKLGALFEERVDRDPVRLAVIASSAELRERERTKTAALTDALARALADRGADEATLLARVVAVCFQEAVERWMRTGERLDACLDAAVAALRSTADLFPDPLRQ